MAGPLTNAQVPTAPAPAGDVCAEVDALNQRAWELRLSDAEEGVRLAKQAWELARAVEYGVGEAYAFRNAGACHCLMQRYDDALSNLDRAGELFREIGDNVGAASVLNYVGNVYWRRAEYPAALRAQMDALALQRADGERTGEGDTLNHLGNIYYSLSDFPRALEHYRASLALKEVEGDDLGMSQALNNIGNIYGRMGQYQAALDHHERTLASKRQMADRRGEAIALVNVGSSYEEMGDFPLALKFYQQALRHGEALGDLLIKADVLRDLGDVHRKTGDLGAALRFYRGAIDTALRAGNASIEAEARIGLGQALTALGDRAAVEELRSALAVAERLDARHIAYKAHLALSQAHEAGGGLALALEHLRAYHRVKDEVHGAEAERRIQTLLVRAEIEHGQREAELLRARNDVLAAANEEKARLLDTLRTQAAELERLTREDALTGVFNRRHLDALLALEWERARRFARQLTAVMVDVDHFKAVNDGWSHAIGDAVLRQVARILRDDIRTVDVVGRYGGEEFVLLLVETALGPAALLCEKLRAAIEAYDWLSIAPGLRITASFGVAANDTAHAPDSLLAAADARLYAAKHAGRNRVVAE